VRELENALERAFILETSSELSAQHLPESVSTNPRMRLVTNFPDEGFDLEMYVEGLQKGFLEEALRRTNGVQVKRRNCCACPTVLFATTCRSTTFRLNGDGFAGRDMSRGLNEFNGWAYFKPVNAPIR